MQQERCSEVSSGRKSLKRLHSDEVSNEGSRSDFAKLINPNSAKRSAREGSHQDSADKASYRPSPK